MLSRVADSFYWMSRYLERAEHSARVLDVHLSLTLDDPTDAGRPVAARGRRDAPAARMRTRAEARRPLDAAAWTRGIARLSRGCVVARPRERAPDPRADQLRDVGAAQPPVPRASATPSDRTDGRRRAPSCARSSRARTCSTASPRRRSATARAGTTCSSAGTSSARRRRRRCSRRTSREPASSRDGRRRSDRRVRRVGRPAARVRGVRSLLPALHGRPAAGAAGGVPAAQRRVPAVGAVRGRSARGLAARDRARARPPGDGRPERFAGRLRAALNYGTDRRDHGRTASSATSQSIAPAVRPGPHGASTRRTSRYPDRDGDRAG